jgi:mannose-6-phosphate isomerase-like protein (cupin superfamily)
VIHIDVHQEKGERFKVLRTTDRTQLAMMTLPPGGTTSNEEGLTDSDQVIYVVEGRIDLTVGDERRELRAGEVAVIPAATPHRLRVLGRRSATLLNVYGPPAYPAESGAEVRAEVETRPGGNPGGYGGSSGFGAGSY